MEEWRDIPGYKGEYQVSSLGNVRSFKLDQKGRILATKKQRDNYIYINLLTNGRAKTTSLHRLVAKVFLDNPDNLPCVNHIDGNKNNCAVSNLEWINFSDNNRHAIRNKLKTKWKQPVLLTHKKTGGKIKFASMTKACDFLGVNRRYLTWLFASDNNEIKGFKVERMDHEQI